MVRAGEAEDGEQREVVTGPVEALSAESETVLEPVVPAGARQRIAANLAAIRVLREVEQSGQEPTQDQREALKGWTSWGAVPQIFSEGDDRYATERAALREMLDAQEWKAARRTTINAHYTADEFVRPMWEALGGLGFTGGQVLEPGCGGGRSSRAHRPRSVWLTVCG